MNAAYVTHPALHLRDARDAHIVFEAVRLNIVPLITRRLTANERDMLTSGNVFVWEEAEHKQGGLERWTDGRRWSQSRMRGDFLFYEEKIETTIEEKEAKAARRARRTLDPFAVQPAPTRRQDRPSKPDGLTKQTYSTHVHIRSSEPPRKWHIVAYFSGDDYTSLPVVDNYEYLRNLRVPEGIFASTKGSVGRIGHVLPDAEEGDQPLRPGWIQPSWSSPPSSPVVAESSSRAFSMSSSSSSSSAHTATQPPRGIYPPRSPSCRPSTPTMLPRLSTVVPIHSLPPPQSHRPSTPSRGTADTSYSPLTPEDRRALNSFRVTL